MMLTAQRSRELYNYFLNSKHPLPAKSQPFSSLSSLLCFCNKTQLLQQIHSRFIIHGLHQNPTLSSELISRYAKLGRLDLSRRVFDSIDDPDAPLYNAILRNLASYGKPEETLLTYRQMLVKSLYPNELTFPFVLRTCSNLSSLEAGVQIHTHLIKLGFDLYVLVGTALVEMYKKHCDVSDARRLLEIMPVRSLVSWNAVISGVSECGDPMESFRLFERMRLDGFEPDSVTVVSLLRSCTDLNCLEGARFFHLLIVMNNLGEDLSVCTTLLTVYSKLGSLEMARVLFDKMHDRDCVVWNIMISAYSRNGHPEQALELLVEMGKSGTRPDLFTAIASLASVVELKSLTHGKQIHGHVIRNGSDYQASVHNLLIDMYSKCNRLELARKIFGSLTNKTIISWSSMIKGYVNHDYSSDALSLFGEMKLAGLKPDSITLINVLPACVNLAALEQVKSIHGYSIKQGLSSIISFVTALLVSYAKCGCIEMAHKLFDEEEINRKDIVSWNSMIGAYSKHGNWNRCFELYNQMKDLELRPDQVTFLELLTACVNSGLVKEGWECFNDMVDKYGHQPEQEHFACMVDLLGRSGHLNEAVDLIEKMPFKPDVRVWGPLLSTCKMHSETRLAEFAAERLIEMEPKNAGNYVLLSNIYAAAGKWDGVSRMRSFLRGKGLKKTPGCSWLEIYGCVHEFRVMDHSHPQSKDIFTMLKILEQEIKTNAELLC